MWHTDCADADIKHVCTKTDMGLRHTAETDMCPKIVILLCDRMHDLKQTLEREVKTREAFSSETALA